MSGIPHGHVFEEGLTAGSSPQASFEGLPTHSAERNFCFFKKKKPNGRGCARVTREFDTT